jgi:hypothetical protein
LVNYDKDKIKQELSLNNIFDLIDDWGGQPEYIRSGIVAETICHNAPGVGSRKLYYYENSKLFHCYTGCENSTFDIFELYIKIVKNQFGKDITLFHAVKYIATRFGFAAEEDDDTIVSNLEDWKIFDKYERIQELDAKVTQITLKEYDSNILFNLNYNIKLTPWLNEGMTQEALDAAKIGYYPGGDQITIPHFDQNNRFIGLRGRYMSEEDCENFGKYRPLVLNGLMYNHPLGLNLYNLNLSKDNIKKIGKAIVFESEKSCLLYKSYFGLDSDITVACCGSSLTTYQIQLLINAGAKEIIIGYDRQFQKLGDAEYNKLRNTFVKFKERFKNYVDISFILDTKMITGYKASPVDEGAEKFLTLYKERTKL